MPGKTPDAPRRRGFSSATFGALQHSSKTLAAWSIIGAQDPFKDERYIG